MNSLILIGTAAFILSFLGVAALRGWVQDGGALAIPNARSSHSRPTPIGGGLMIVFVTLLGLTITAFFGLSLVGSEWRFFIAGAMLIAIVGWFDDLHPLPFGLRFFSQGLGAVLIILSFGYLDLVTLPVIDEIKLGWLGLPVTFLLIVGMINANNFMDGIDGLAGLQSVLGGLAWVAIGTALLPATTTRLIGILLGASSLGFLIHNWAPARIFMGDVGSTFIGFTFAVLIIYNGKLDPRLVTLGLLILWPFIWDTSFTFLRRLLRRENVFEAHRTHLYQRLVICGFSHRFVTLLYAGLSLIGIMLGTAWYYGLPLSGIILVVSMPLLVLGLYGFVLLAERRIIGIGTG